MPDDEVNRLLSQSELRLEAARHLLKEGFCDDAVSRAYYSMYFATSALFLARNIQVKTHRGLIARFGQEFVEKGLIERHFGRILRIAEELRSEADYSITREISEEEAAMAVEDAEMFLHRAREVIDEIRIGQ
ncbi:MAG TPA: HEPN domain-containing protein [Methanotrichaceae archaeon]|nr:HEPN domain-containing protein [Methanotrichaceae archaeon]